MTVDLNNLAQQFRGRRFAELILEHVRRSDLEQNRAAVAGLLSEMNQGLTEPITELIDFLGQMPQSDQRAFFSEDCGKKFKELIDMTLGFMQG